MAFSNRLSEVKNLTSANYTIQPGDEDKTLHSFGAGSITVPVNSSTPLPIGFCTRVRRYASGACALVADTGVTIRKSASTLALANQYDSVIVEKIAADEWVATFDNAGATATYKVYAALLTNSGGTVTAIQLQNTLGDGSADGTNDIQWTNPSNGFIAANMTNAFVADKTWFMFQSARGDRGYMGSRFSATQVLIQMFDASGVALGSTDNFTKLPIEIRVYN